MKLAFIAADGSVTILGAAPKDQLERSVGSPRLVDGVTRRVLTDEEYRKFVIEQNTQKGVIPEGAELVDLPDDWQPPDGNRCYRAAWKLDGDTVAVDLDKAKTIHVSLVRAARDAKLKALDEQWMASTRQKKHAEAEAIDTQAQVLRDIPQSLDLSKCETVEQLKAAWPEALRD